MFSPDQKQVKTFSLFLMIVLGFILAGCSLGTPPTQPLAPTQTALPTFIPASLPFTLSEAEPITTSPSVEENWSAACEKDGKLLITRNLTEEGGDKRYRIGSVEYGTFAQLTPKDDSQDVKPSWVSQDCGKVVFEKLSKDNFADAYIINSDGTDMQPISLEFAQKLHAQKLHSLAPRGSQHSNLIVLTLSECTVCVPEPAGSLTSFGIVNLDHSEKSFEIIPPHDQGWGYASNPALNDANDALIFNVNINGHDQIAQVTGLNTSNFEWKQLTLDAEDHFRPTWLPGRNDAFIYTARVKGKMSVFLGYKSQGYNLTEQFNFCKDPDVVKVGDGFRIIATCNNKKTGASDFFSFTLKFK